MRGAAVVRSGVAQLIDFCYPPLCEACREMSDGALCDGCERKLAAMAEAPACGKCGMPAVMIGDPCAYCEGKGRSPLDGVVRFGAFDPPLKDLIHAIKYHRRWTLGETLADRMYAIDRIRTAIERADVIVPVPLHWWRHLGRGYNQAEVIARRLGQRAGRRVVVAVKRIRHTESQTAIHAQADRVENVRGAFRLVRRRLLEGKRVVIVDDVMTTGATIRSMARALKEAGPAEMVALVAAIADPKGRHFQVI